LGSRSVFFRGIDPKRKVLTSPHLNRTVSAWMIESDNPPRWSRSLLGLICRIDDGLHKPAVARSLIPQLPRATGIGFDVHWECPPKEYREAATILDVANDLFDR